MEYALRLGSLSLPPFPRKTLAPARASSHARITPQNYPLGRSPNRSVLLAYYLRSPARRLARSTGERPQGSTEEGKEEEMEGIYRQEETPGTPDRKETEIATAAERKEVPARGDTLDGVLEEIRMIEWPEFGRVLGTTGVVLSVIAGSSVVLLTVNAVFAELSDRVFAGKGIQDFFG